jgi:hypothetical protein
MVIGCIAAAGVVFGQQPLGLDTSYHAGVDQVVVASVLPLPDGRLVVSGLMEFPGSSSQKRLAALGPDGSLAPDFAATGLGGGGITPWEDSLFYVGNASIVRRVHLDGTADYGFSMSDPHFTPAQGGDYHVYPDGRVLLTGRHGVNDPTHGFDGLYSLIWFSNTGHYDTTRAPRQTNGAIYRIAPLPNGQFYCGGAFTHYEGVPAYGLVRVQPDGTLDSSFNAHIAWGQPWALLPMADGGVMVGGDFLIEGGTDTLRLMRFLPDGSLDPGFNDSHTFNRTNSLPE